MDAPATFFQCPDAPFHHWNMFFTGTFVEYYLQWGELTLQGLELSAKFNEVKSESTLHVYIAHFLDRRHNCSDLRVSKECDHFKIDRPIHCHEEGHLPYFHNANMQYHLSDSGP